MPTISTTALNGGYTDSESSRRYYDSNDEKRWGRTSMPTTERNLGEWLRFGNVKDGSVIVELGCGRGAFRYLSERYSYVGIDLSFEALKDCIRPPSAVQADITKLPIASEHADFVFSIAALEHVPRPELVLSEVNRILKPGGIAYLAPAWFCRPWAAKGLPIKRYSELALTDKILKALIPVRNNLIWRSMFTIPHRLRRELQYVLASSDWEFKYKRLSPNLREYIYTDCDAFCSLDPHEGVLLFKRWGYEIPTASNLLSRLALRHEAVVVQKPVMTTAEAA